MIKYYYGFMKYVLLKCDWFDENNCNSVIKVDEYGSILISTNIF